MPPFKRSLASPSADDAKVVVKEPPSPSLVPPFKRSLAHKTPASPSADDAKVVAKEPPSAGDVKLVGTKEAREWRQERMAKTNARKRREAKVEGCTTFDQDQDHICDADCEANAKQREKQAKKDWLHAKAAVLAEYAKRREGRPPAVKAFGKQPTGPIRGRHLRPPVLTCQLHYRNTTD